MGEKRVKKQSPSKSTDSPYKADQNILLLPEDEHNHESLQLKDGFGIYVKVGYKDDGQGGASIS